MSERFLNDRVELHCDDCRDVLATLPENSLDACVTDPPYGLQFMGREWDKLWRDGTKADAAYVDRTAGELTSRARNLPDYSASNPRQMQVWHEQWALAVYRVLKPGAHLVAMGGTRTYHRLACAIEDAGFEIRDTVSWLYGSGFPKSHDVSKGIDRAAGAEREVVGQRKKLESYGPNEVYGDGPDHGGIQLITTPATDAAREWAGWGTALKPACELIVLARKPLSEGTVAANVLRWGCGAINVDGCRVGTDIPRPHRERRNDKLLDGNVYGSGINGSRHLGETTTGRWPANVVHDGSDEVMAAFPESNSARASGNPNNPWRGTNHIATSYGQGDGKETVDYRDEGSAARFFYTSKADADDRLGSKHPTVKPVDLMQWLVRLVTPKGGLCLDPFTGTGTTGEAAWREGMRAVLIEAEPEYQADIRRRMALALSGPDERQRESIKARNLPRDDGPLFAPQQAQFAQSESRAEMWAKPFDFSQEPSE